MTDLVPGTTVRDRLADALVRLVADNIQPNERWPVLKDLAATIWKHTRSRSALVSQGASVLEASVPRLPIRDVAALRSRYGSDVEAAAGQLVAEAARHAGWAWAAMAAIPAPSRAVRIIDVLIRSAIEVRMVGELYSLYGAAAPHDTAWLGMVLSAWAVGRPVAAAPSSVVAARDVAARLRQSSSVPASGRGRLTRALSRRREGSEAVSRLGWRFRRRMRTDPGTWASPNHHSAAAVIVEAAAGVIRGGPGSPVEAAADGPGPHLGQAWSHHLRARSSAAAARRAADPRVLDRLSTALDLQDQRLRWLGSKLGYALPAAPSPAAEELSPDALTSAHAHAGLADDGIDVVEDAGSRAGRLGGWPVRVRNGLVYLVLSLAVTLPAGLLVASQVGEAEMTPGGLAVLALSSCGLPALVYGLGVLATGWLFRPWLGGRVPRSPILGLAITVLVSLLTLVVVPVIGSTVS